MIKNRIKGSSLIEIIIYVSLMSVFLVVLMEIFLNILTAKGESESTSTLNQDLRFIFSRINYDVSQADNIVTPSALGQETDSLVIQNDDLTYTYATDSGRLVLTSGGLSSQINSKDTDVESISFKRLGNEGGRPTVKMTLTLQDKILDISGGRQRIFETTLGTR